MFTAVWLEGPRRGFGVCDVGLEELQLNQLALLVQGFCMNAIAYRKFTIGLLSYPVTGGSAAVFTPTTTCVCLTDVISFIVSVDAFAAAHVDDVAMDIKSRNVLIQTYFKMGLTDHEIVQNLHQSHQVYINERHVRRQLVAMNLRRRCYGDLEDTVAFISDQLLGSGRLLGYRIMHGKCKQHGLQARKEDVRLILQELDSEGVMTRRARRLIRRQYYAPGPNFIWHLDGNDKLVPYGIGIHGCIDGFSRKLIWLNAYVTNKDPMIIANYFVDAVVTNEGCPRILRGDAGTENVNVKVIQEYLRRNSCDSAADRCYLEGASTCNQRIESWWGFMRKHCIQYWMDLFQSMRDCGEFQGEFLDKELIRFCFLHLIQAGILPTNSICS